MNRNNGRSTVVMSKEVMTAFDSQNDEPCTRKSRNHFATAQSRSSRHYLDGDTLDAYELGIRLDIGLDFKAKFDCFANALH